MFIKRPLWNIVALVVGLTFPIGEMAMIFVVWYSLKFIDYYLATVLREFFEHTRLAQYMFHDSVGKAPKRDEILGKIRTKTKNLIDLLNNNKLIDLYIFNGFIPKNRK